MSKNIISFFCLPVAFTFAMLFLSGCHPMSEKVTDKSAGLNGGFEIAKDGLPVNWLMYTPKTVADADFKIVLDREIFREGKQSLKFDVNSCSSKGGWNSPGFTNEFFEAGKYMGENNYKISFWIKNKGSEFHITAGGVAEKTGNMSTLMKSHESFDNWKQMEFEVHVAQDDWLRIQLNILQPGTFWIDDIRIEKE